jgi:hypothetical protein
MFRDKNGEKISKGSKVLKNGSTYLIKEIFTYSLATEAVCENIKTHQIELFQLRDLEKI